MRNKAIFIILSITLLLGICSCKGNTETINPDDYSISRQSYFMYLDTISTVTVEYNINEKTSALVESELKNINHILLNIEKEFSIEQTLYMLSNGISESTLMKVNNASGKNPVVVSDSFLEVINKAKNIYELSSGGFDPTIGPLTMLWDISGQAGLSDNIPNEDQISNTLDLIDFEMVEINNEDKTVFLPKKGMILDLGGIAKGFAADEVMNYLRPLGYTYISVNLGGNLYVWGSSKIYEANNRKVSSEIQNPFDSTTTIIKTEQSNVSIVTSGVYERYIEVNGKKYHHILNPKTGYPFENELVMVTIVGNNSCLCDGLSTGIFSLGLEEGIKLIKKLEGFSAFFVTTDYVIYSVGDIEFELTPTGQNNFELIKVE